MDDAATEPTVIQKLIHLLDDELRHSDLKAASPDEIRTLEHRMAFYLNFIRNELD